MTRACVIGWPIEHSRSPMIHNYWLQQLGIDGSYEKVAVPPDGLAAFIETMRERGLAGCNVTIPHKEAAFALAEVRTKEAEAVGAANTLWFDDQGRLNATSTDGDGFMANLDATAPGWNDRLPVLVLGAGGAARAIVHALLKRDIPEIRIANRTRERADVLQAAFAPRVRSVEWHERETAAAGVGLLVNATALGMSGKDMLEFNVGALSLSAVVADIVYVPMRTKLIADAEDAGLRTVGGLGMLLYQAAPAFEVWFKRRPTVTPELHALVARDITGR